MWGEYFRNQENSEVFSLTLVFSSFFFNFLFRRFSFSFFLYLFLYFSSFTLSLYYILSFTLSVFFLSSPVLPVISFFFTFTFLFIVYYFFLLSVTLLNFRHSTVYTLNNISSLIKLFYIAIFPVSFID